MPVYTDSQIQETILREELPSGLRLAILPRHGQRRTFATFATYYGSIDSHFRVPTTGEDVDVPDGIAHFLEHKMFEKPDGDVFDDFGRLGASSNAYTEYLTTTYLFSTTAYVEECLQILLDFVQRPYFTEANVEKEKGIIEQEIRMYLDMPGDRIHANLMKALYQRHPARLRIAGTVESIRTITPDILHRCYETFYHPSNMLLFLVGDVDPERIRELVWRNQAAKDFEKQGPIMRYIPDEPPEVAEKWIEEEMPVALPLISIGYKDPVSHMTGPALLRRELTTALMWGLLLGKSSPLFADLYEKGLVNDRFGASYSGAPSFAQSALGGETPDPIALTEILDRELKRMDLRQDALDRLKKREWGEYMTLFDSPQELAYVYNSLFFRDVDLFSVPAMLDSITLDDVEQRRDSHLQEKFKAVSVILPPKS